MMATTASRADRFSAAHRFSAARGLLGINWLLILLVLTIGAVGVAMLYSAGGGSLHPWADRHALRLLAGAALVVALGIVPLRLWSALAWPAYVLALGALILVPVIGVEALGAKRWLRIGGASIQPSELMKVALIVVLAWYYQWLPPSRVSRPLWVALPLVLIAAPVALVLKQPDLGTATLFAAVGLGLMYLAGVSHWWFAGGGAGIAMAAPILWDRLHDYQRRRFLTFLDPEHDPLGAGYHIIQSKIALGSGGVAGRGLMHGTQAQLDFLPEKHTDFIFTVLGEETGYIGAVTLLGLYLLTILLLIAMAMACRSQFARLVTAGAALVLSLYATINVAMVTGLVPVVGVPLPLVSFGGTAMMTLMTAFGIAMSAWVHRRESMRG